MSCNTSNVSNNTLHCILSRIGRQWRLFWEESVMPHPYGRCRLPAMLCFEHSESCLTEWQAVHIKGHYYCPVVMLLEHGPVFQLPRLLCEASSDVSDVTEVCYGWATDTVHVPLHRHIVVPKVAPRLRTEDAGDMKLLPVRRSATETFPDRRAHTMNKNSLLSPFSCKKLIAIHLCMSAIQASIVRMVTVSEPALPCLKYDSVSSAYGWHTRPCFLQMSPAGEE